MTVARAASAVPDLAFPIPYRHGVVVGFDDSPGSAQALSWAVAEALARDTDLVVISAGDVSRDGGQALIDASRTADLLVVGQRGRGSRSGALLGSVASAVMAGAHCPVVVVPDRGERRDAMTDHVPRAVVVGVDGSAGSDQALVFAALSAARGGLTLRVMSAWTCPGSLDDARWAVTEAGVFVRAVFGELEVEEVFLRRAAPQALREASVDATLVVVGARGRGSVGASPLGPVGRAVLQASWCPVAVVRTSGL